MKEQKKYATLTFCRSGCHPIKMYIFLATRRFNFEDFIREYDCTVVQWRQVRTTTIIRRNTTTAWKSARLLYNILVHGDYLWLLITGAWQTWHVTLWYVKTWSTALYQTGGEQVWWGSFIYDTSLYHCMECDHTRNVQCSRVLWQFWFLSCLWPQHRTSNLAV